MINQTKDNEQPSNREHMRSVEFTRPLHFFKLCFCYITSQVALRSWWRLQICRTGQHSTVQHAVLSE